MNGFEGPVEGSHGTWSVGDCVGETPRWTTYRGTDEEGTPVAIRTPTGEVPSDRYDRFDALARQWATVDERRTVRGLLDWGTDPRPWVAVEYVPDELDAWAAGTTLDIARACDPRTRAELLFDVCEVLRTYSRYGSTPCHLALHPDCLSFRVDGDGPVAVVDDWGLSRLVEDPPTTPYTAPEQLEGDHASKRTDVYRIGALAAAALGDGSTFPGVDADDPGALADAIRGGVDVEALSETLPKGAVRPIRRATASDPADRYGTTYPLGRDLLDAVPTVDTGDREADALAATVAPTPEESEPETEPAGAEAASSERETGAGETESETEDDGGDAGAAAADSTDASGPSPEPDTGDFDGGNSDGGSRRSFLKYGIGAFALAGVGMGGLVAMDRNEPTNAISGGGSTSADGSESGSETESEPDPEEESTIEVTGGTVTVDAGYFQWLEGLPDAVADSDVPDVVDVEMRLGTGGEERLQEFVARVEAGEPKPDVMVVSGWELGRLFAADATEPLSTHANDHPIGEVIDPVSPGLDAVGRRPDDGELHALPYGFMPEAVVYRKPMFEEAGFGDFDAWMTDPPTWSEWSQVIAESRREEGFLWSGLPRVLPSTFAGVLAEFGGAYYETDGTAPSDDAAVTVTESPGVLAANLLHDLAIGGDRAGMGIERTSPEAVFEYDIIEPRERFLAGEAVAAQLPLSLVLNDAAEPGTIGVMPTPATDRSRTTTYGSYVVVNPNTELLGEALSVVRGFRSESVGSLLLDGGRLPTRNGDPFSGDTIADSEYEPHEPAIRFMLETAVSEPPTPSWAADRSEVGEALQRAIRDDPERGLEEAASVLDRD